MIFLCHLRNNAGTTIAELVVAMGIASLLLVFVMTGSLFVENYLKRWKQRDAVSEELLFLQGELASSIRTSRRMEILSDTIRFTSMSLSTSTYTLDSGAVVKDGGKLSRTGMHVDCMNVGRCSLPIDPNAPEKHRGLYKLLLVVSDERGNKDTIISIVRNEYEDFKYSRD